MPVLAVTVHVWLAGPPTGVTLVIDVPARVPPGTSVKFEAATPLTASLNKTVHWTLEAVVRVGVPGGLSAGKVSMDCTWGAEALPQGPNVTRMSGGKPPVPPMLPSNFDGTCGPPGGFAEFSSNGNP